MAGCISFVLIMIASTIAMAESRVIPAEPISITLDSYGNPVMFLREKRTVVRPYPHKTMMLTGYYRPIRRTGNGGQASGVFAQGNAVSGEAFFGGVHSPHLKGGPEPIGEVSSAEAQAAPAHEEEQEHEYYHHQNDVHRHEEEQHHHDEPHYHHHHNQDSFIPQEHHELEKIPLTTEIAQTTDKPIISTEVSITRPKEHHKKTHKTPVTNDADDDDVNDDGDDYDDDEDKVDEENDEPAVPFVPFKKRRRQGYPHLNNFFPMVFSFPRLATRAGSSGSLPGAITAIANSYSTGKGGVASSVATAYGGSPIGKKRRTQPYKE